MTPWDSKNFKPMFAVVFYIFFLCYECFVASFSFLLLEKSYNFKMSSIDVAFDSIPHRKVDLLLPELVVFDLDMCVWSPEMYTLSHIPGEKDIVRGSLGAYGEGVIGVKSDYEMIRLFPSAMKVLQDIYLNVYGNNLRIAVASSADTPHAVSIGRAAMNLLEVLPGVTLRQVIAKGWPEGFEGNIQVGRTPPLSSNKAETHFPILRRETQIAYENMIFLDDCNCKLTLPL